MIRGTTPSVTFKLPFNTNSIKEIRIAFTQNSQLKIIKILDDCEKTEDALTVKLTEAETLKLISTAILEIQLRIKTADGEHIASNIIETTVDRILDDEPMGDDKGENLKTVFGKVAKYFTDLKTVAFTGSYSDLSNKPTIPTNNNQLTNGAGYQTASDVQTLINDAIGGITGIQFSVVSALPTSGTTGVIYLVSNGGANNNIYDEYIWVNSKFEKIGTTDVDLSGYVKTSDLSSITNSEIDTIIAS